jgi:peroxiredoxin
MNETNLSLTLQNGTEIFNVPGSLTKNTVLYFMRASTCPQCNRHTRELEKLLPELQQHNLDVVIIVPEDIEAANKVKERNQLTMPVMAGNGAAHALAGLDKKLLGLIQQSGTVVVDQTGKVLYKKVATNPEGSFNGKEFQAYIATL